MQFFQQNVYFLEYAYNAKSGSCYKLHATPLNWTDAYNVCSAEQSYLAVLNNWMEVDELVKLTETGPKDWIAGSYLRGMYHVGFHNRFNDGWSTVKGTVTSKFHRFFFGTGRKIIRCGKEALSTILLNIFFCYQVLV